MQIAVLCCLGSNCRQLTVDNGSTVVNVVQALNESDGISGNKIPKEYIVAVNGAWVSGDYILNQGDMLVLSRLTHGGKKGFVRRR